MTTPNKHDIYQVWIDRILVEAKLTQWEQTFVDSIQRQLHLNTRLSLTQADCLERIYSEKTK